MTKTDLFNEKMREQLQKKGMTQTELAEIIDVTPAKIQQLCHKQLKEPALPVAVWLKLSEVFGVPLEYWATADLEGDMEQTRLSVKAWKIDREDKAAGRGRWARS